MNRGECSIRRGFWLLAVLLWCAAWSPEALGQQTTWDTYNQAEQQAYVAGQYAEAERIFQLAIEAAKTWGPSDIRLAASLNNLAGLYCVQGKYNQAERLYKRALVIDEKALGPNDPVVARDLNNLAELYRAQGKYDLAEPMYKRALAILEKALGPDHPDVATVLENYALLLDATKRPDEAAKLRKRAEAIRAKRSRP